MIKKTTVNSSAETITYAQLTERFGIKRGTAYALVSQNRIPHIKIGRRFILFPVAAVTAWLEERFVDIKRS